MNRHTKQRFLAVARRARLLTLLDAARFLRCRRESAAGNRRFLAAHPEFVPPPLWWMHDMYRHTSFDLYWRMGKKNAAVVAEKIARHVKAQTPHVADWGCGLARVIRHLPESWRRTGFDYNAQAIDWCKENIPGVEFYRNSLMPPLTVGDGAYDALYALSVFTHLSAEAHLRWIAEIERVLKPGGVFIGAFHMALLPGQLLPGEQARFNAGELVVRGGVKEGSRTYTAYHPERYLREQLLVRFEILEGPIAPTGQTLFVARRRA